MAETVAEFESRTNRVDGLLLHAKRSSGPTDGRDPLVLVHGLGLSHRYLMPTARRLAGAFEVWAPDQPGFGLSESPRSVPDMPGLADWLGRWIEAEGLGRVHLLANSIGCQIAIHLASSRPEQVGRLVLQGPTIPPEGRSWPRMVARWLRNYPLDPPELKRLQRRDYRDCGTWRSLHTLLAARRDRPEDVLPTVEAPTLVVRGARDPICTPGWADRVCELLPNGWLATVPGAAHTMVYVWPDDLIRVARPFLLGEPVPNTATQPGEHPR